MFLVVVDSSKKFTMLRPPGPLQDGARVQLTLANKYTYHNYDYFPVMYVIIELCASF